MWQSSDRTVNKQYNLGVAELEHIEHDTGRDPAEVYQFVGKYSRRLSLDCTLQCARCLLHQWLVVLDIPL